LKKFLENKVLFFRHQTDDGKFYKLPPVKENEAEITDMIPGEKYLIQVNTASFGVESTEPLEVTQTVRKLLISLLSQRGWKYYNFIPEPNPVTNIASVIDSVNVTLEWPLPEGRIDFYFISWKLDEPINDPDDDEDEEESSSISRSGSKNISSTDVIQTSGKVGVLIGELIPGAKYSFEIYTTSHELKSDVTSLTTRTSKILYIIKILLVCLFNLLLLVLDCFLLLVNFYFLA